METHLVKCPHCGKEYSKNGIGPHIWRSHGEGKSFDPAIGFKNGTRKQWCDGKKLSEETKRKIGKANKGTNNGFFGKHHNDEIKKQISESMKENGTGGFYSRNTVIYKLTDSTNKEVILQSNYELEVAKSLDENKIKWVRPKWFKWTDENGDWHKYYPDFYLPEYDIYLDPKNSYLIKRDLDKIERVCIQNGIKVLILNDKQLHWDIIKNLI